MHQTLSALFTLTALLALAPCVTDPNEPVPLETGKLGPPVSESRLLRASNAAPDLIFPLQLADIASVVKPTMAEFKPAGKGPFPGLVLAHQCGGLDNPRTGWTNRSMLTWALDAVARGYVVPLIDQLTQRGVDARCHGMAGGLNFMRAT